MGRQRTPSANGDFTPRRRGRAGSRNATQQAVGRAQQSIQYANPRTGERGASTAEGVVSYLRSGELDDPKRPNKWDIDEAIGRDAQLQALVTATVLPLLFSEGHVEEAEGNTDEADLISDILTGPEWERGMTTPIKQVLEQEATALFYRQAFFEKVWTRDEDGTFRYHKLAFREATTCRVRQDPTNGSFNGYVQEGVRPEKGGFFREEFDPLYAYVFVHGHAQRPLLGTSLLQAPWHEHMHKNKLRWLQFRGFAKFGNGIIHMQTARTEDAEIEALEEAGNNVLDGGVLITADDEPVNLLTPGGQAQFLDTLRELDSGMARAFLLPQIGLGQGDNTGTYALAKEHQDLFIMLCESRLNQIADNRTRFLIPPLVYLNRGPNAAYPSWKFPGLTDEGRELAKEIFIALLGRPAASVHPVIKAEVEKQVARQLGADADLIPEHDDPEREVEQVPVDVAPDGTPVADAQRAGEAGALQQSLQQLNRETGGQVAASGSPLGDTTVALHGGPTDKRNIPAHNQKSHGAWAPSNRFIPRWKQKGLAKSPTAKGKGSSGVKPPSTVAKGLKPFTRGGKKVVPKGGPGQDKSVGWQPAPTGVPMYEPTEDKVVADPETPTQDLIDAVKNLDPKVVEVDGEQVPVGTFKAMFPQDFPPPKPAAAKGISYDPSNKTIVVPSGTHEDDLAKGINTYPQATKVSIGEKSTGGWDKAELQKSMTKSYRDKGKVWPTGTLKPHTHSDPIGYTMDGKIVKDAKADLRPGEYQGPYVDPEAEVQPIGYVPVSGSSNKAVPVYPKMPQTGSTYKFNMPPYAPPGSDDEVQFWSGLPSHKTFKEHALTPQAADIAVQGEYNPNTNILYMQGPGFYDGQALADTVIPKLPSTPKKVLYNDNELSQQTPADKVPPAKDMPEVEMQSTHFIAGQKAEVPFYLTPPPAKALQEYEGQQHMGLIGKHNPQTGEGNVLYYDYAGTDEMFKEDAVFDAENEQLVPQQGQSFSGDYFPTAPGGGILSIQSSMKEMPQEMGEKLSSDFPELDKLYFNGQEYELGNMGSHKAAKPSGHHFDLSDGTPVTNTANSTGPEQDFVLGVDQQEGNELYIMPASTGAMHDQHMHQVHDKTKVPYYIQGVYDPQAKHVTVYDQYAGEAGPYVTEQLQKAFPEAVSADYEGVHLTLKGEGGVPEPTGANFDPDKFGGHFDTLAQAEQWARKQYNPWWEALPSNEQDGLRAYKDGAYTEINGGLRKNNGDVSKITQGWDPKSTRDRIHAMDKGIAKAPPLEEPIVVYRGRLPNGILDGFVAGNEKGLVGKEFVDHGYQSTSLKRGVGKAFKGSSKYPPSVGKITVPKGSKVAYLESGYEMGEAEVLLPRGTKLRVTKVYKQDGTLYADAEAILPEAPGKPKKKAKLTPDQRAGLIARLKAGEKVSALAAEYGLSTGYLYDLKNS